MILTAGMAHPRKLIRQAVVTLLTNVTAAGARVSKTRFDPHRKSQLPAISVYSLSEPVRPGSAETAPRELTRDLKIEIAAWVPHTDAIPVDDAMDNIAEQIEAAMDADRYLNGAAGESILESTEMAVVEDDGKSDPTIGIVALVYSVTYRTTQGETATDDFITVNSTQDIVGGVVDTVPIVDQFTVQETP